MTGSATMKDVAERAGVSLSTVSYVLGGIRPIEEPVRAQILKAMEELHYHPQTVARLAPRTRVLALLFSPHGRAGFGPPELEFIQGATEAARALDHHLVLLTEGMDGEASLGHLGRRGLVDGVILMEVRLHDPRVLLLQNLGLPFSLLGRPDPSLGLPYADVDFDDTFRTILDHLKALGHRSVGFLNQGREAFESGYGPVVRAQEAWERWGRDLGLETSTVWGQPSPRGGWEACTRLLDVGTPPTALVAMNDRALPGLLQALAARGLEVPRHLSLVSAVTTPGAALGMVPALTSADVPCRDLARIAVANLVRTIEDPRAGLERNLVPCVLTDRGSTGPRIGVDRRGDHL